MMMISQIFYLRTSASSLQNRKHHLNHFKLAHQELIQKPRYITNCWVLILKLFESGSYWTFKTTAGVAKPYEKKHPTAKMVNKLFHANIFSDAKRQRIRLLKRYVKSLERFLHFLTGSDVLACKSIEVVFISFNSLQRRPIVHPSRPSLHLPSPYKCFTDLVDELQVQCDKV